MSEHVLNQSDAQTTGENVSIVPLSTNTVGFIKRKAIAFFNFLVKVSEEINKARAEQARYSRMRW